MKAIKIVIVLLYGICLYCCKTEDYVVVDGGIEGLVMDSQTKEEVVGCEVITMKYGTKHTDKNGYFYFANIEPGVYTLMFKCNGYEPITKEVTVIPGVNYSANVYLTPVITESSIYTNHTTLDFGNRTDVLPIIITNPTDNTISYYISTDADWISTDPSERGSIVGHTQSTMKVSVDRSKISVGHYEKTLTIKTSDKTIGVQIVVDKGDVSRPVVNTISISQGKQNPNSVEVKGSVLNLGNSTITQHGFCYSVGTIPTITSCLGITKLGNLNSPSDFTGKIIDLEYNKEYYVAAYATNNGGTAYGDALKIILFPPNDIDKLEIVTTEATDIKSKTAILNGQCKNVSTSDSFHFGFYYGTTPSCDNKCFANLSNNSEGLFKYSITDLQPDTQYYFKAFVGDADKEKVGETKVFRTQKENSNDEQVHIVTESAKGIQYNSATLSGSFVVSGNTEIKEYGFYLGTVATPTIRQVAKSYSTPIHMGMDPISYELEISELKENSKYYYQAYVIDSKNKMYKGSILSFVTSGIPSISIEKLKVEQKKLTLYDYSYTFSGEAILNPQGHNVIEAGFIFDGYEALSVKGKKIICEIFDDKISFDYTFESRYSSFWGYAKAYMIFEDGTIIYSHKGDGKYFY